MKKYYKIIISWILILSIAIGNFTYGNAGSIFDYLNRTLILRSDFIDDIISITSDDVLSEDGEDDENLFGEGIERITGDIPRATDSDIELELATASIAILGDTLAVDLNIKNMVGDTTNDEDTFWVTENIPAVADISISGNGASIPSPWVVLTVPKLVIIDKPTFVDSQNAQSTLKLEDSDNYYVLYKFDALTGGTRATFPFPFRFKKEPTVNGDSIRVKLEILDASGVVDSGNTDSTWNLSTLKNLTALYSTEKTYIARNQEYRIGYSFASIGGTSYRAPSTAYSGSNLISNIWSDSIAVMAGATTTGLQRLQMRAVHALNLPSGTFGSNKPLEYVTLKVILPEGATPNESMLRQGWIYDADTNTASFKKINPVINSAGVGTPAGVLNSFMVDFNDVPFNQVFETKIEYTYKYPEESEQSLPTLTLRNRFEPSYFDATGGQSIYKTNLVGQGTDYTGVSYDTSGIYTTMNHHIYDKAYDKTDLGMTYEGHISNENNGSSPTTRTGGRASNLFKITDILLQDNSHKIYYKTFQLVMAKQSGYFSMINSADYEVIKQNLINEINTTPNVLYGIDDAGIKHEIARNVQYNQRVDINDTDLKYNKLSLEFAQPIKLDRTTLIYYTRVSPVESELEKFADGTYSSIQRYVGDVEAYMSLAPDLSTPASENPDAATRLFHQNASVGIAPITPKSRISVSPNQTAPYQAGGTFVDYYTNALLSSNYGNWGGLGFEYLQDVKLIQLLPQGFEYGNQKVISQYTPASDIIGPEVIDDYKGTGRQALVYSIPRMKATDRNMRYISIRSKLRISEYAQRGLNKVDSFLVYPKNDIILPDNTNIRYEDALDLDDDGDTNELFITSSSYIDYIPPLELIVTKKVGYDVDSLGLMTTIDQGREFYYGITLFNNTIAEVASAHVIDVLPYVGDHAIAPNQAGNYPARGSVFPAKLTRAIEDVAENAALLSRFDIYYQIEDQGADLASVRDGNWVTAASITDWSSVKSIKIALKTGQKLNSKEEVTFYIQAITEMDRSLNAGTDVAVNSAAVSTDGRLYSEGNSAKINIAKYTVKGTFFKDLNDNGIIDTGEVGIGGKTVVLLDADTGNPVRDSNGDIITTTTDASGNYSFNVYERGNYKVQFTKAADEEFTPVSDATNIKANNGITVSGNDTVTNTFELSPSRSMVIRNTGIVSRVRDIEVLKISSENAADGSDVVLSGAKFKLMAQDGTAREAISGINGKAIFADVPFGIYTLKEIEAPDGYVLNTTDIRTVDVNDTDALEVFTFTNEPIKVNITIKKVDADDATTLLSGVTFELKDKTTGTSIGTKTTDTTGKVVFEDVGIGTYELIETANTDISYVLPTGTASKRDITVTQDTDIEITMTNTKKKSTVKVIKKDTDTREAISGIRFALKQGGVTKYTGTTDTSGEIIWTGIPYGEYTLVETDTLENYIISTVETPVSVSADGATLEFNIDNTKKKGSVTLTKVDADDNTVKLQGVRFGLFHAGETVASYEAVSDTNGVVNFTDVVYGNYILKEISTLQNYVLWGGTETVNITTDGQVVNLQNIENRLKKGKVIFTKVDADTGEALAGVTFALKQGGVTKYTATSGADGSVTFDGIIYGIYDLVEVSTLDSHNILTTTIPVNIDEDGKVINLDRITNTIKKASVRITKVDADSTTTNVAGVQFGLFKAGATTASYTATTGDDGVALFTAVNYGDYILKEISVPDAYVLSSETKNVAIRNNDEVIELGNFENRKKKSTVIVTKVDAADATVKIPAVGFGLYTPDDTLVYTTRTDVAGVATFPNVPYGRYILKEMSNSDRSYVISDETREVVVDTDGATVNLGNFTNRKKKGSVTLTKVDADDNTIKLAGVRFGLFKTGETRASYEAISDTDGIVRFDDVIYGDYILKEISTLENYNLSTVERNVTIDTDGQVVDLQNFENVLKKGSVSFTKVDADNPTLILQGVRFGLYKAGEANPSYEAESGTDGTVRFTDVVYGRYILKEISTLINYNLSAETREVNIVENGRDIPLGTFTNVQKKGSVTVKKVDAEDATKTLQGVTFGLYKTGENIPAYTAVTGADGIATFTGVVYGTYQLKEVTSLINYNLSAREERIVIDTEGQSIDVGTFTNQIIKGSLRLQKVDADTRVPLAGVEFALKQNGIIKYTAVSQTDGSVVFDGVVYGEYKLVETRALDAYNALTSETDIRITTEGQGIDLGEVDNRIKRGSVKLRKVDAETGQPLAGIRFGLYEAGQTVPSYEASSTATGEVLFSGVKYGRYVLKEIETLVNYNLSTETREVLIDTEGQEVDLGAFTNRIIKGAIRLRKIDGDSGEALAGVRFALKQGGVEVYTATTDNLGYAVFTDVVYGEYDLTEVQALDNYIPMSTSIPVSVRMEATTVDVGDVANYLKIGRMTLHKVDADDADMAIAGVKFGLYKEGATIPTYTGITDANGDLTIEGIRYGRYLLKEMETLENYVLSDMVWNVNIDAGGEDIAIGNISNKKIKGSVKLVKVDADTHAPLAGVTFALKQNDNIMYQAVSGADGTVVFDSVLYGRYILEEISTLDSHNRLTETTEIAIDMDGKVIDLGQVENRIKKGSITLTKVDEDDNNITLAGVRFGLYKWGASTPSYEAVSGMDGVVVFSGINYGRYILKEISTLQKYGLSDREESIDIDEDEKMIDIGLFTNRKLTGDIHIYKRNPDGQALAGVEFLLYQDNFIVDRGTTDENGKLSFLKKELGDYRIKELNAPDGYILEDIDYKISLTYSGEIIEQVVINKKIKERKGGGGSSGGGGGSTVPSPGKNENPNPPSTPNPPEVVNSDMETNVKIGDATATPSKPLFNLPKTGDGAGSIFLIFIILSGLAISFVYLRRRDKKQR